jgi:hypothetical protein
LTVWPGIIFRGLAIRIIVIVVLVLVVFLVMFSSSFRIVVDDSTQFPSILNNLSINTSPIKQTGGNGGRGIPRHPA